MIPTKILLLLAASLCLVHAAVTINAITGVTTDNLVFSGTIPISTATNLFFTYYGVDGQKDQAALKNYPLLIFVGKYNYHKSVLAHLRSTILLLELGRSS